MRPTGRIDAARRQRRVVSPRGQRRRRCPVEDMREVTWTGVFSFRCEDERLVAIVDASAPAADRTVLRGVDGGGGPRRVVSIRRCRTRSIRQVASRRPPRSAASLKHSAGERRHPRRRCCRRQGSARRAVERRLRQPAGGAHPSGCCAVKRRRRSSLSAAARGRIARPEGDAGAGARAHRVRSSAAWTSTDSAERCRAGRRCRPDGWRR
jgi:hypothetical protein